MTFQVKQICDIMKVYNDASSEALMSSFGYQQKQSPLCAR